MGATHDARNLGLANTIVTREGSLRYPASSIARTELGDLRIAQLRAPVAGAAALRAAFGDCLAARLAALRHLVGRVFSVRAKPQVIGVDAKSIITGVADAQSIGDRAVYQHPGHAVRKKDGSLWLVDPQSTIAPALKAVAGPEPAPVSLADSRPETFDVHMCFTRAKNPTRIIARACAGSN